MGDGLSIKVITQPTITAMKDMTNRTDRATMWALREVGRQVKQQAKKRAPVYKGKPRGALPLRYSQFKKFQKVTAYKGSVSNNIVIAGLLKNSISSSKRFKREAGGAYVIKVGPRGQRTHLYAGKIEAMKPYMRGAYDEVIPRATEIHAKAWTKAMNSGKK